MKKKIRWKLLGSLRVFHCLTAIFGIMFRRNNFSIAILLILFSLAIINVDAKIDKNNDSKGSPSTSDSNTNEPRFQSKNGDSISSSSENSSLPNGIVVNSCKKLFPINCTDLKFGQFQCPEPEIDKDTQQPVGCGVNNLALINCTLRDGLICDGDTEVLIDANSRRSVQLAVACEYTNGYSYEITLLLSIFFGMFGLDRFYLGYPAIGLLKFCTLGFLFIGQFIDIILIAMQIVRPADGSYYIIKQFGPKLMILKAPYLQEVASQINARLVTHSAFEIYFYPDMNMTFT